jgi:stress response protein SCP2
VICLDEHLRLVDTVWKGQLESRDQAISHGGDKVSASSRKGSTRADNLTHANVFERIRVDLNKVDPSVHYIGFLVDSFSGQDLSEIDRASCRLFDPATNKDLAKLVITQTSSLDGYTALLAACLYRNNNDWCLYSVFEAMGTRPVKYHAKTLQHFIRGRDQMKEPLAAMDDSYQANMPTRVPLGIAPSARMERAGRSKRHEAAADTNAISGRRRKAFTRSVSPTPTRPSPKAAIKQKSCRARSSSPKRSTRNLVVKEDRSVKNMVGKGERSVPQSMVGKGDRSVPQRMGARGRSISPKRNKADRSVSKGMTGNGIELSVPQSMKARSRSTPAKKSTGEPSEPPRRRRRDERQIEKETSF